MVSSVEQRCVGFCKRRDRCETRAGISAGRLSTPNPLPFLFGFVWICSGVGFVSAGLWMVLSCLAWLSVAGGAIRRCLSENFGWSTLHPQPPSSFVRVCSDLFGGSGLWRGRFEWLCMALRGFALPSERRRGSEISFLRTRTLVGGRR